MVFFLWLWLRLIRSCAPEPVFAVLHRYLPHLSDCLRGHRHPLKESDKWSPFITIFQQCRLQAEALEECLCEDQACARLHLTLLFWKVLSRNGVLLGKKGGTWKQCRKCQLWGEKCSHTEGDAVICFFLGMEFHEELHNLGTKEGLKGRKLSKAIESFAWNITVLKVSTENALPCGSC